MTHVRVMVLLAVLAALGSLGMAMECSRPDDDDAGYEYASDDDGSDDDDDVSDDDLADDDATDDDLADDDATDDDATDDDATDDDATDDDTGDDDTNPPPDGYLTGDWRVRGNAFCWIGGVFGFSNDVDGELYIEHYRDGGIFLYDEGEQVGTGEFESQRELHFTFDGPWGFEEEVYQDPDYSEMTMDFFRVNDNRFNGSVTYKTHFFTPWISYECRGYVRMTRQ